MNKATKYKICMGWRRGIMCLTLFFMLFTLYFSPARAQNYGYTDERPLVIAADWDFRPFEFLNTDGQPSGYNIEVLDLILTQMNIPHKFIMQEWHTVNKMFARHEADLIHALTFNFKGHPYVTTKKYINYYKLMAARHMDTPPLYSLRNLTEGDTLMLKEDDYGALILRTMGEQPFIQEFTTPKSALSRIRNGNKQYFIWGELPLKRKIQELNIDGIALDEIDIPAAELRIIGYNPEIINLIDDEYTRLEQAGDIQPIYDRWFHPERQHDNASPWAPYILGGMAIVCLIAFFASRLITIRVKKAVRQSADLNSMMRQALNMGDYYVAEYDLHTRMVANRHGRLMPPEGITIDQLIDRIDPNQQEDFRQKIEKLASGEVDFLEIDRRWNAGTKEKPNWRYFEGNALLERQDGKPRYIIHTVKDVTRDILEEAHNKDLSAKYKLLFDTNILAMSFYDKDGNLLESNQKMREICFKNEKGEQFFFDTNLFNYPGIKEDYDPNSREPFHACYHALLKNADMDLFVENKFTPLFDDDGQLMFYIVTTRDITADRQMYLQMRDHERQLIETNKAIQRYDQQLSYLLEENKIFVWYYNPQTDIVRFSRKPHVSEFAEPLNQFMNGVPENSRASALIQMREFIAQKKPFTVIYQYRYTPMQETASWFSVSGMPEFNADGQLKSFFGIARDITQLMAAQEKLKLETARAEDSGRLKSAFLANMTHEIRTPLNAIVGFSDLLQMVDNPTERLEFIRIISNNCDMLLRLINDILEASSMGQSLTIEPKSIDLAHTFDDICRSLEQRVQTPNVQFQKDNPYTTYSAVLDAGRLQQLLTNFVTNAVKYTHEGHIRVGYREENKGVYFYCEDTGTGIPAEKQASVFERFVKLNDFVQGTGLGLSICKAIVEKCGGRIGVKSQGEGHGSTFWFWLPREIQSE